MTTETEATAEEPKMSKLQQLYGPGGPLHPDNVPSGGWAAMRGDGTPALAGDGSVARTAGGTKRANEQEASHDTGE